MRKYIPLLFSTLAVSLLFLMLDNNLVGFFDKVEQDYKDGLAVNLSGKVDEGKLSSMLLAREYVKSKDEAAFIASKLASGVKNGLELDNIHALKKHVWKVGGNGIDTLKTPTISERYLRALENIGVKDSIYTSLVNNVSVLDLGKGGCSIEVSVTEKDSTAGFIAAMLHTDKKAVDSVMVALRQHLVLTIPADTAAGVAAKDTVINEPVAYAFTGKDGKVVFKGLDGESSYSVLPISMGYEFGSAKGTVGGSLKETSDDGLLELEFTRKELRVPLFGNSTLSRIKEDGALTVRSPEEFKTTLFTKLAIFFALWWSAVLFMDFKKRKYDSSIVALLMLLTGFCLLNMFSLNNPLTDKMLGVDMSNGIFIGIILIALIYNVDFVKFYQGRLNLDFDWMLWLFKPFRRKVAYLEVWLREKNVLYKVAALVLLLVSLLIHIVFCLTTIPFFYDRIENRIPKGLGYVLLGIVLTVLLFSPLGQAVGGMRVNLNVGILFQPSEITKYLIVIFMAAYFCRHADNIVKYSAEGNASLFGSKLKSLGWIIAGLGVLMVLYMALGDMGPALVIAFTFIIMYSLVKSKAEWYDKDGKLLYSRILTSDIAMLMYGVLSFLLALWLGSRMGSLIIGGLAWFFVWILYGISVRRQFYETPVLFNLIIFAFILGGPLLSSLGLEDAGKRLESRTAMCANVWGELGLDGEDVVPGENGQVAHGLWALSSGGMFGQGLAGGDPHEIPAFHTDMVLESIGEQMGFIGLLVVVMTLAMLMRRVLVAGFRTSHPFAFYLCLGIAIVTAVQFMIISLGSTGMMPLTGVTVPFFSYGKVSMILNLAAMGVVIAISGRSSNESGSVVAELNRQNIGKYTYSLSVLIFVYLMMMALVLGVFLNYQVFERDATLVRPLYVKGEAGNTTVEYNPRIQKMSNLLKSGNIYDRNGVLLATSDYSELEQSSYYSALGFEKLKKDHRKRYYPFGEHLFFMLGDANSKLFFQASDAFGIGYVAEYQHMSDLRGYKNTMLDSEGNPVKVVLEDVERPSRFMALCDTIEGRTVTIRDYSALVPFLKAGRDSKAVEEFNATGKFGDLEVKNMQLTVDAELQIELQKEMENFVMGGLDTNKGIDTHLVRMSVVVLDAKNGDLLASSVYPLPDYERLEAENGKVYSDKGKRKDKEWTPYSDVDLGLRFASHPGSTAKVMSAIAGVNKLGRHRLDTIDYYVAPGQTTGLEPKGKYVDLREALVISSNCYFINLVNEYNLYNGLRDIYAKTGVSYDMDRAYTLTYKEPGDWGEGISALSNEAVYAYNNYIKRYPGNLPKYRRNKKYPWRMDWHALWQITWGQGSLDATPLAMARVASAVANNGKMPVTQYLLSEKDSFVHVSDSVDMALIRKYMIAEGVEHTSKRMTSGKVGGKTGTAEREYKNAGGSCNKMNDVWYMCFLDDAQVSSKPVTGMQKDVRNSSLAVVVRIERLPSGNHSTYPKGFVKDRVLPLLGKLGYGNFD